MEKNYYLIKVDLDITNSELKAILESKGLKQNLDVCEFDWLEESYITCRLIFVYGGQYFDAEDYDFDSTLEDYFGISESEEDINTILLSDFKNF